MSTAPYRLTLLASLAAASAPAQPCDPAWSALGGGVDGKVLALAVFDDGSGPALYAGGEFQNAGGQPAACIARWDGHAWSPVGAGPGADGAVRLLETFDDGGGLALYAMGQFTQIDGVPAPHAARWDGHAWSAVGDGLPSYVTTSAVFDDGKGPALFVGGRRLKGQDGQYVVRLDGDVWTPLEGLDGAWWHELCPVDFVYALEPFDDGSGPALYAAGRVDWVYGLPSMNVARWTGSAWEPAGGIVNECAYVPALAVFDDGGGPRLLAASDGGGMPFAWDGADWIAEADDPLSALVNDMHAHDDGGGPALYAGLDSRLNQTYGVTRWNGSAWSVVGGGIEGREVNSFESFQGALIAAGEFTSAGGTPAANIARWGCPPCLADCDASGALDFFDFVCFINLYNTADPDADCDVSGGLDLFDFLCFVNAFNTGC